MEPPARRSFALNYLDYKLRTLCDFEGGIFVEAGANDGLAQSNTLYLEKYQRWSGLLIEGVPELASACRKNRPACQVENAALVSADRPGSTVTMQYCGLMSVVRGAMKSVQEEESHIAKGCALQQIATYPLEAPARTLSSILNQHGFSRIDLLSLDVEGYELEALRGIDFSRHRPALMLVEARYRRDIDTYLKPLYEPVAVLSHHDVLYRLR